MDETLNHEFRFYAVLGWLSIVHITSTSDMLAHLKSINIPIAQRKLNLGIWQGIYLCEPRNYGGNRRVAVTLSGQAYE